MMAASFVCKFLKRMLGPRSIPVYIAFALSLGTGSSARGEASFTFEPVEADVYVITGSGMANLAALDFTITYDPATLQNPRLTKGPFVPADASFMANTAIVGELRLLVIRNREIAGDGTIATVAFERVEGRKPGIRAFKSSPISVSAAPVESRDRTEAPLAVVPPPASVADSSPVAATGQVAQAASTSTASSGVTAAGQSAGGTAVAPSLGQVSLGKVSFPGDEPPTRGTATGEPGKDAAQVEQPTRPDRPLPAVREPAREQDPQRQPVGDNSPVLERYPNVPERFREYAGPPTLAGLTALFAGRDGKVRQTPAIVLSDGVMTATISVAFPDSGDETPAFLLEKARLVSLHTDEQGWQLTVLPEKGTSQARLTVRTERVLVDFPLTVVPPLPALVSGLKLDEGGLKRFLNERGTVQVSRFDLNGDGLRDYLDDYIFVAHLLAAKQVAP